MANSDIYAAISQSLQAVEAQRAELESSAALARKAGEEIAASAKGPQILPGTGGETAGSLMQKKQAELEAQRVVQKVAAATDIENLMVVLGQDMAALAQQQRAVTDKIVRDSSVSLFEDPLTAIANAFTLPWDEQELEGINTKMTTTADHMAKLHAHVQQSGRTAEVISTKVTEASLAEVATAAEALQVQTAAKARLDAAKANADAVTLALTADSRTLDLRLKERAARQQDEQMELARKREERQMQILDKQMKDVEDKEAGDRLAFEYANAALIADGKNPLKLEQYKMWKGTSAEFLNSLITKGMQLAIGGKENYTHGNTIEERFKWQLTTGWKPETPQQETVMLWQSGSVKQASEMPLADKKQAPAQANSLFVKKFKEDQNDIREGSPFMAPSFSDLSKSRVGKSPLWLKYVAPTLDDKSAGNPVTPQFIVNAMGAAVANKEISVSDAAQFATDVFRQSVEINNAVHQFRKIAGLDQTKYGARIHVGGVTELGGFFAGKMNIEATDKAQWNAAIARQVASRLGIFGAVPSVQFPEGRFDAAGLDMYQAGAGGNANVQIPPMPSFDVNLPPADKMSVAYQEANRRLGRMITDMPRTSYEASHRTAMGQ